MSIEKPFMYGGAKTDPFTRALEHLNKGLKSALADSRAKKVGTFVTPIASKLSSKATRVKPTGTRTYLGATPAIPIPTRATRVGVYDPTLGGFVSEAQLNKMFESPPKPKPVYTAPVQKQIVKKLLATAQVPTQVALSIVEPEIPLPTLTITETNWVRPQSQTLMRETNEIVNEVPELENILSTVGELGELEEESKSSGATDIVDASAKHPLSTYICRVGTKEDIAIWLTKHMPPEALRTYVEPFIGGGAIYLVKEPAPTEAINDWNYTIVKQWKTLKDRSPSEMLKDWSDDKDTRAYVKSALFFRKTYLSENLNLKRFIEEKIADKGASAEKRAFGKIPASEWTSKLLGNKLRFISVSNKKPTASNEKSLMFKDLKDDSVKKYSESDALFLYALYRAGENLLDQTRANRLSIEDYTGGAGKKASKSKPTDLISSLEAENLPNTTMAEWLRKRTDVVDNPDKEATEEEKKILKGKTTLVELIYEKIRSCGGFGGSGVIDSTAMIAYRDGKAKSPVAKVPMDEIVRFLLSAEGGLHQYNQRLAKTEVYNGDYYELVKDYDSPNTFFMLDPPYQATGGYGNKYAFNFEAFIKSMNGIPDPKAPHDHPNNPKIKGKVLITINGGDKLLAWFRKYARQSGIKWYGLKAYVRQKAGEGGYRYEIFYGTYKFDDRAEDILSDTFSNNWSSPDITEEDKSQFKEANDRGAIYIESDGTDKPWEAFKKAKGAVGHFDRRNATDRAVIIAESKAIGEDVVKPKRKPRAKKNDENVIVHVGEEAPKPKRKPRAKKGSSSYGGYYGQNQTPHQGAYFGYTRQKADDSGADEPIHPIAEPIMEGGSPYESGSW